MNMDRPFDIFPASVDSLDVLIDLERLQTANDSIRQIWVDFYSSPIDADGMKYAQVTEARRIIYEENQRAPKNELLIHFEVEIKTVTTSANIESERASLKSVQLDENSSKVLWPCNYDEEIYKSLVHCNNRIKLIHHVSFLGLRAAFYVKSSPNGILYAVLVFIRQWSDICI